MLLEDVFTIEYGQSLELNRLTTADNGVNFVSRTAKNNGVSAKVRVPKGVSPAPAGCLSVALGGSVLATFLQPEPFVCGRDVAVLTPKNQKMSTTERLWWCAIINANAYRYSFGRQANTTLRTLSVPDEVPSWVKCVTLDGVLAVHDAAVSAESQPADPDPVTLPPLDTWGSFRLDALFDVKRGGREKRGDTTVPYVTSSARNNGVTDYRELVAAYPAGTLTVACDGSIGSSFYQPRPYAASSHVCVLTPREGTDITEESALFVCTLIRQEAFRYSFGRAWQLGAMRATSIRLPVTAVGDPDWDLMTRYILGLPYSSVLAAAV